MRKNPYSRILKKKSKEQHLSTKEKSKEQHLSTVPKSYIYIYMDKEIDLDR